MAGKGKLKGLHLPLRAYIMYLLLICFALTGVTFSKYVTSTCGGDSARVAKIGSVTVTENGEPYNSDVIWRVAPGADITKNAVISFSGSELASYVFSRPRLPALSGRRTAPIAIRIPRAGCGFPGALRRANGNTSRLTEKMFITRLPARTKALTNRSWQTAD